MKPKNPNHPCHTIFLEPTTVFNYKHMQQSYHWLCHYLWMMAWPMMELVGRCDNTKQCTGIVEGDLQQKLAGFGANVMTGRHTGVSTCLEQIVPGLISLHCAAHKLALTASERLQFEISAVNHFKSLPSSISSSFVMILRSAASIFLT